MTNIKKGVYIKDMDEELLQLLTDEQRQLVLDGVLKVYPGKNPLKPVLRKASTGGLAKGTGRTPKANDIASIGRKTAYTKKTSYREALEKLVPVDGDKDKRGSFAWWLDQAHQAAEGSPQDIKCPKCHYTGVYAFKKDGQLIFKLLEMMAGKARETQDLNIRSESLVAVLNERQDVTDIIVHTIDPGEARQRKELLSGSANSTIIDAE